MVQKAGARAGRVPLWPSACVDRVMGQEQGDGGDKNDEDHSTVGRLMMILVTPGMRVVKMRVVDDRVVGMQVVEDRGFGMRVVEWLEFGVE